MRAAWSPYIPGYEHVDAQWLTGPDSHGRRTMSQVDPFWVLWFWRSQDGEGDDVGALVSARGKTARAGVRETANAIRTMPLGPGRDRLLDLLMAQTAELRSAIAFRRRFMRP